MKSRHTIYKVEDLLTLEDDGDRWLVDNMIPRIGRTIVYGTGGTYKTTLLFDLAVAVASRGALLRQFPIAHHGPVFLVSTESSKYTNRDRLLSHIRARESSSPEMVYRLSQGERMPLPVTKEMPVFFCHQSYDFDDHADRKEFEEALHHIHGLTGRYPAFILLDPLDSFISGDENSAKETKPFRKFCDHIVDEYETSLCVIHHSTKDRENPTIRGSSAWRGWADTSLLFRKQQATFNNEVISYVNVTSDKQRDGQEGHIFSVVPEFNAIQKMTTFVVIHDSVEHDIVCRSIVQQRVLEFIRNTAPVTQTEIINHTGFSHKRIKLALEQLTEDGYIAKDTPVVRSTSPDSNRSRTVLAWRATAKISQVDAAVALLKAAQQNDEANEHECEVDIVGPVPRQTTESTDVGQTDPNFIRRDPIQTQ